MTVRGHRCQPLQGQNHYNNKEWGGRGIQFCQTSCRRRCSDTTRANDSQDGTGAGTNPELIQTGVKYDMKNLEKKLIKRNYKKLIVIEISVTGYFFVQKLLIKAFL